MTASRSASTAAASPVSASTRSRSAPASTPRASRRSTPSPPTTPSPSTAAAGWVGLGGYVKQISATVANTIYAIGKDNGVYINRGTGTGLFPVGGYAKQISAGADAAGNPEVFGIGADNSVLRQPRAGNFANLGGYAKQISATMNNTRLRHRPPTTPST